MQSSAQKGVLVFHSGQPQRILPQETARRVEEARLTRYSSGMSARSTTLALGSPAPKFILAAANRERSVSLQSLMSRGPVILEFLRGTW